MNAIRKQGFLNLIASLKEQSVDGFDTRLVAARDILNLVDEVDQLEAKLAAKDRPMREIMKLSDRCLKETKD